MFILLAGVILLHLVCNLLWMGFCNDPPSHYPHYDYPGALARGLVVWQGYPAELVEWNWDRTRILLFDIGGTLAVLLGPSYVSLSLVGTLGLIALILGCFELGRMVRGDWTGLLAAALVGLYPMVYSLSRMLQGQVVEMAFTVWLIILALKLEYALGQDDSRYRKRELWLAALLLAAWFVGFLIPTEMTYLFLFAFTVGVTVGPILVRASIRTLRGSTPQRTRRLAILAVLGVGFIVVAAVLYYPDYILAGRRFPAFYYGREAGGGGDLGIGSPSLLKGLLAYPQEMAWHTVGLLGTLALLPAAVLFLRDRQNRHRSVLIVWALVPYIVLNISLKKWGYYLSNIFPALAVITAAGIMSIKIRWLRNALAALLVLAGIVGMDARSFYLDAMRWPSIIGVSYGHPNPYVRRPGQQSMAMLYDHIADLIQDGLADVERPDGVLRIGLLKVPAFGSSLIDYRLKQREPLISAEAAIDEHTGEAGQLSRFDVLIVVWPSDLVFKSGARDHQPFGEGIVPMSREELVSIAESDGSFVRAGQRGPLIFFEKHH